MSKAQLTNETLISRLRRTAALEKSVGHVTMARMLEDAADRIAALQYRIDAGRT